jgi:hypothetical protein
MIAKLDAGKLHCLPKSSPYAVAAGTAREAEGKWKSVKSEALWSRDWSVDR